MPILTARAEVKDSINHASFGADGKAWSDIKSLFRGGKAKLIAVAEVDDNRAAKVRREFPDARIYKDWRELLRKEHKNLDSVNVSTPDHMHAPIAMSAMALGLHVYGQKPLAHDLYETRKLALMAKKTGLITQMGNQLASSTYERLAVRLIQDGVIGKVKEVHMFSNKTWGDPKPRPDREDPVPPNLDWEIWCGVGPKPPFIAGYYHPGQWRKRLAFGTGTLGDMGCHIYSPMFGAMGFKYPLSVKSTGGKPTQYNWAINERFEYIFPRTKYAAGKTVKVTWCDGNLRPAQEVIDQVGGQIPDQGTIFIGTKGALLAPHGGLPKPFPVENFQNFRYPKFPARDHYKDFMNAVRGEDVKPISDFYEYGGPLTEAVLLGSLASHFPNETLEWDARKLQFKNHPAANKLIRFKYRKGWEVRGLS
jgi:predicted dehydrogenase